MKDGGVIISEEDGSRIMNVLDPALEIMTPVRAFLA